MAFRTYNAVMRHAYGAGVVTLAMAAGLLAGTNMADAGPADPPANKLTLTYYDFSSGTTGADANLRHTFPSSTVWIGGYRQSDGFDQLRAGYEYDYRRGWLTLVPSAQAATHGFVGTTVYAEVGRRAFAIGGAGRTNLRPYWNLGFDPNDYVQFGAGVRDAVGNSVSAYAIHDNRLGTGQTNTHIVARRYLSGRWRLTVDAVHEHGSGDEGVLVSGWAASIDLDWRVWFVKVAHDPHVNYTPDRQWRIAAGVRF